MSFLNGGQDFVVAGNNRRRGGGGLASLGRLATQLAVQKHLISHRADEQIRVQGAGHESKAKWGVVSDVMKKKTARQDQLSFEDDVMKRYDDDHDDVKSGKVKKGEDGQYPLLRPILGGQYAQMGQVEGKDGSTRAGSQVGVVRSQEVTGRPDKTPSRTPPTPKPPKTPKPKFDPNNPNNGFTGYTPRKTGTGGYDEALKSGAIDQETYDSYLEDGQKPGKDYMPKQASTAIDTLVKERDGRKNTFDTGSSEHIGNTGVNDFDTTTYEHISNVDNAWGDSKITSEEAADLSTPGSKMYKKYTEYPGTEDDDESIANDHIRAGLDDKRGTEY